MKEPESLDIDIEPGTKQVKQVNLAEYCSRNPISFTTYVVRGKEDGPVLTISAASHGNELAGVECIRRFIKSVDAKSLRGTIIGCPILNPVAYAFNSRNDPHEQIDMNRSFPGDLDGSLTELLAYYFFTNMVSKSDMVIDFHTAAYPDMMLPHVRVRTEKRSQEYKRLVDSFGADMVWFGKPHPGMLQVQADKIGIPAIGVELGAASLIKDDYIEVGTEGIENVLIVHDMLPGVAEIPDLHLQLHLAHDQIWQRSSTGGLFVAEVQPGDYVHRGQLLGWINDLLDFESQEIRAEVDGLVVGRRMHPLVRSGSRLFVIFPYDVKTGSEEHQQIVKVKQLPHSIHRSNRILKRIGNMKSG